MPSVLPNQANEFPTQEFFLRGIIVQNRLEVKTVQVDEHDHWIGKGHARRRPVKLPMVTLSSRSTRKDSNGSFQKVCHSCYFGLISPGFPFYTCRRIPTFRWKVGFKVWTETKSYQWYRHNPEKWKNHGGRGHPRCPNNAACKVPRSRKNVLHYWCSFPRLCALLLRTAIEACLIPLAFQSPQLKQHWEEQKVMVLAERNIFTCNTLHNCHLKKQFPSGSTSAVCAGAWRCLIINGASSSGKWLVYGIKEFFEQMSIRQLFVTGTMHFSHASESPCTAQTASKSSSLIIRGKYDSNTGYEHFSSRTQMSELITC